MQTEIEAKFLAVDHDLVRAKLQALGAECAAPQRLMKRKNLDFKDKRLEKTGGWVRVRDEGGGKVTLAYKQVNDRTLHGTKEVQVTVSSFDETITLLQAIGLTVHSYQETKRESWRLGNVEVELDQWPWIKPFVELEGPSEAVLKAAASRLGLDWGAVCHGSVEVAYQAEYDVTEAEIDAWPEITFTPVPGQLQERRRK
jgi:adenylate cyclase, class 2